MLQFPNSVDLPLGPVLESTSTSGCQVPLIALIGFMAESIMANTIENETTALMAEKTMKAAFMHGS